MPTIPQKEIRNNVGEILRRAEAGEEFTITVSGRPVARLLPLVEEAAAEPSAWVESGDPGLQELLRLPAMPEWLEDIERASGELRDPWEISP